MKDSVATVKITSTLRPWLYAMAMLVWCTLVLRLGLAAWAAWQANESVVWAVLGSFGYFTVLTTLLTALAITAVLVASGKRSGVVGAYLGSANFAGLVTTSLVLVALVYTLVLRSQWQPEGVRKVVDSLLHDVIPLAFLLYGWLCVPRAALRYRMVLFWLCYPTLYLLVVLILGLIADWYPYPFLDVPALGPLRVRLNVVALLALFAGLGVFMVWLNRRFGREVSLAPEQ